MSLYISIDENNNITGYGKHGDILISTYPSIDGQPANKSLCYWTGSAVELKTNEMLVAEYHKSEFEKLGSEISSNLTKLKKPKKVDDAITKFHEKNDLTYTTRQQVLDAIQEVRDDIF